MPLIVLAVVATCIGLGTQTAQAVSVQNMTNFGFGPRDYKTGYNYGNGVYFAPRHIKVYAEPKEGLAPIEEFYWRNSSDNSLSVASKAQGQNLPANQVFLCFYPSEEIAMMAVVTDRPAVEIDDINAPPAWLEVIINQATKKTGWVKIADAQEAQDDQLTASKYNHVGIYQTWLDFMKFNAKAYGIYWLNGVSAYQRSVRTSDKDEASMLNVTVIRDMKVRHLRGNWMLVEVVDFERNTPIGWVRWRDNDGNLMVFPNIKGDKQPIITTGY